MTNSMPVLVVEDEADSVLLLQRAFKKAEIPNPIQPISNGALAIDHLSKVAEFRNEAYPLPAFVLLDLKLPRKSGVEVLKWVRAHPVLHPTIVVVLTSSTDNSDVAQAYSAGANSYLVKPTSLNVLIELVQDVRNYWLRRNQPPITKNCA